ncbi:hypothetical protein Taro_041639 [Colocasia esculenta]|uniref:Uncharacterized protein n=1 Tax=Colocasia esculenta TaxID=4460 RepID=A0A843WM98_COLES|nr:hypothetical protein [Colocasia esculenta]
MASDKGDAFKRFKRGVCPGRDFDQSVKSFVLAIQSRGCFVLCRGGCCGVPDGGFPTISTSDGSCGTGTTRGRCSERGRAVDEEVLAFFSFFQLLCMEWIFDFVVVSPVWEWGFSL